MRRSGWRRLGKKRFRYVDSRGATIADPEQLERIAELAIPPAWTDVWISPNPRARLQATGVDAAGRKQYRYHAAFRAAQERAKYERLLDFGHGLPKLRRRAARHLRLGPYEREWACAPISRCRARFGRTWVHLGAIGGNWVHLGAFRGTTTY